MTEQVRTLPIALRKQVFRASWRLAQEAAMLRELLGPDALIVTPGVRPVGAALGDQSRVATPKPGV